MLDFADASEYDNAVRGLIDAPEVLELTDAEGNVIWSQAAYSFLDDYEQAPDTVNPSLWENTRNNHAYGLFEVCPGIYQVRGYDMANLTVIKGDTGWIVFDCTMCSETAQAAMAKADFDKGEYQWVAEITNLIVFADPTNEAARLLCADALEQLGYQAESGPWRNAYLTAALELRYGNQGNTEGLQKGGGIVMQMTPAMIFDYMGILMDKEAMADQDFTINVTLSDFKEQHVLHVKNGVLLVYENTHREDADVSITCPKNALLYILINNVRALDGVPMEGNVELITLFAQSMNQMPVQGTVPFNIIEP